MYFCTAKKKGDDRGKKEKFIEVLKSIQKETR
jgi:hypothetical protein